MLAEGEFRELMGEGALVEVAREQAHGQARRRLEGSLDGVPVLVRVYESKFMNRVELGARFPEALGVDLELVSTGRRSPAGLPRSGQLFAQLFDVRGERAGRPVAEQLSPELKQAAILTLERFGGELAVKEGGVLWTRDFAVEGKVELAGQGGAILRAVRELAALSWAELRSPDPRKRGRPAPPLTGAPARPGSLLAGGLASLAAAGICGAGGAWARASELDAAVFFLAVAGICGAIGLFLLAFGLFRWRAVGRL